MRIMRNPYNHIKIRNCLREMLTKWNVDIYQNDDMYLFVITYKFGRGLTDKIYYDKVEIDNAEITCVNIYEQFVTDLLDFFLDEQEETEEE